MTYLAVDEDGSEWKFETQPIRNENNQWDTADGINALVNGSIKKLLGYKLTWEDEAVEIGD